MKDKGPSISVSMPRKDEGGNSKREAAGTHDKKKLEWKDRPWVVYPKYAIREGIEGTCQVLLKVGKSGEIEDVHIRVCSPPKAFDQEALKAFRDARYEPFDAQAWGKDTICAQIDVDFCISDGYGVVVPNRRCKR